MASKIVVLALIFFASVGMVSAAATASAPTTSPTAGGKGHDDSIVGTVGGGADDAAPVGGPVPPGVFQNLNPAATPISGAAVLEVSATTGAITAAGLVGSFFF